MRLWSIHPRYLDRQGLVALWREGLLAQKVLEGKTRGYKSHPQLLRFRLSKAPLTAIGIYLHHVAEEARSRGYQFDCSKIHFDTSNSRVFTLAVHRGQVRYETAHLISKLKVRDSLLYEKHCHRKSLPVHPLFRVVAGEIEPWEVGAQR